jgi:hypothetical protein
VNAAELTIVGAVYDLKNDFGQGQARLIVINVNGIQDPARLKAFGDAIMSTPNPNARAGGGTSDSPLDRLARALADPASHSALGHDESEDDEDEEEPPPAAAPAHPAAPAHGGPAEHGAAAPPVVPVAPVMLAPTQPPPAPAVHESPTHRAVPAKNAAPAKRTKH